MLGKAGDDPVGGGKRENCDGSLKGRPYDVHG